MGIVHHDIKPENLLVSKSDGDVSRLRTLARAALQAAVNARARRWSAPAPSFRPSSSPVVLPAPDARIVDLWAIGVALYLWTCGRPPFTAGAAYLMEAIKGLPGGGERAEGPALDCATSSAASSQAPASRLTLNQLRKGTNHEGWLGATSGPDDRHPGGGDGGEIEQAFSNRMAIAYQSAAGRATWARIWVSPRLEA